MRAAHLSGPAEDLNPSRRASRSSLAERWSPMSAAGSGGAKRAGSTVSSDKTIPVSS